MYASKAWIFCEGASKHGASVMHCALVKFLTQLKSAMWTITVCFKEKVQIN